MGAPNEATLVGSSGCHMDWLRLPASRQGDQMTTRNYTMRTLWFLVGCLITYAHIHHLVPNIVPPP